MKSTIKNTSKIFDAMEEEIQMQENFHPELNLYWTLKELVTRGYVLRIYADKEKEGKIINYQADIRMEDLLKYKKMREAKKLLNKFIDMFINEMVIKEHGAL